MRNQKFAKENTARMGKPESAIKKKDKDLKSPISPVWLGMELWRCSPYGTNHVSVGILAFVVFGGLIFELLSRVFYK